MGESVDRLVALAGKLDWSPKKNWVDQVGGLPKAIEDVAVALIRDHGMDRSHAISIAVHNTKILAAKGEQKYVDALAEWEAKKAKSHAQTAAKDASK